MWMISRSLMSRSTYMYSNHNFVFIILNLMVFHCTTLLDSHDKKDITFVILSQPNNFNVKQAEVIKQSILKQSQTLQLAPPTIYLAHDEWPHISGSWTVTPLLNILVEKHGNDSLWLFFAEETTQISLPNVLKLLNKYNSTQEWMLGHALFDAEATIIHHFAFFENPSSFLYPDLTTGIAMSIPLAKMALKILNTQERNDFSIDAKHELAKLIWNDGKGILMTHTEEFCINGWQKSCATWINDNYANECMFSSSYGDVIFAIKTCSKYRNDRVPIVQKTWGSQIPHKVFYSDEDDPSVPTTKLDVANTEHGHCAKTMAILNHVYKTERYKKKWVVIVDDDTLISIPRLLSLLSCYNSSEDVALGERYGFGVSENDGYNYITGGGGMVFSMVCVEKIVHSIQCFCPKIDSPDDMMLGICLKRLGIPIIHSPLFHQARPNDYPEKYLKHQKPISFHKHWMIDPIQVYKEWLEDTQEYPLHSEL